VRDRPLVVEGYSARNRRNAARRKGSAVLEAAERGAAEGFHFRGLPDFVEFFVGLFDVVIVPADFERVAFEVLEDAALHGVRYAEVRWTPTSHVVRGATVDGMWAGLEAGRAAAERAHGIHARWIVDFPRGLPVAVADEAPNCKKCGNQECGTSIQWAGSPSDAATKAKKEEKLVFVLHVSGYFEDPKFT